MPDLTRRIKKHGAKDLHDGEQILKSLVGTPPGSKARGLSKSQLGPDGILDTYAGREIERMDEIQVIRHNRSIEDPLAGRVPVRNVYLTLTDQRMMVHTATVLGKPTDLVAEFAHEEIGDVEINLPKIGDAQVFVTFADGSKIDLLMVTRQNPAEFVAAWESVRPSASEA